MCSSHLGSRVIKASVSCMPSKGDYPTPLRSRRRSPAPESSDPGEYRQSPPYPAGNPASGRLDTLSSLPGIARRKTRVNALMTPQVGFTRLAAPYTAQLGQARVAVQSILFAKNSCEE